jgi:putative membrane protein
MFIRKSRTQVRDFFLIILHRKTEEMNQIINKDLILREKLALQRTILANHSTLLAFLRTALYFSIAALSLHNLLKIENSLYLEITLYSFSILILIFGVTNYFIHRKRIINSEKHIGNYKDEYLK